MFKSALEALGETAELDAPPEQSPFTSTADNDNVSSSQPKSSPLTPVPTVSGSSGQRDKKRRRLTNDDALASSEKGKEKEDDSSSSGP